MCGIDLNKPIFYKHASFRFFNSNEHHVERFCPEDVLLLVYEGVLRFSENGICYEVGPGEYHIQRHNAYQKGEYASDSPKYLYVHFLAEWTEDNQALPFRGNFDYHRLKPLLEKLDMLAHGDFTYIEAASKFFEILSLLYREKEPGTLAGKIAKYLSENISSAITLYMISEEFSFSKNHIINIFKKEFGVTPIEYINKLRIQKAKHLLESTSASAERISFDCGFNHYSHFYRLFMRGEGISPIEWRNKSRLYPSQGGAVKAPDRLV